MTVSECSKVFTRIHRIHLQREITLMERIQCLAVLVVKGVKELPFEERLRCLNTTMESLGQATAVFRPLHTVD